LAREKTIPIGIRNLATLTAFAVAAAIVAAPDLRKTKYDPRASDTEAVESCSTMGAGSPSRYEPSAWKYASVLGRRPAETGTVI
jgi:hypothetical protein